MALLRQGFLRVGKAMDVVQYLLTLLVMVSTGLKAVVLWREPDPREGSGEIEMVGS